jgi:lipoate-protein ligase A
MAVDDWLLQEVATTGRPVLRFYQWSQPTLSLGYFQQVAQRDQHTASQSAAVVRRLSGGGAILHDCELTYSLFLPAAHPLARDTQTLYDTAHRVIAAELNTLLLAAGGRWQAGLCEPTSTLDRNENNQEPFLCFLRRSPGDILLHPTDSDAPAPKVVGSAQRRQRGTILQHGSLLLRQSALAPELPGLAEALQSPVDVQQLTTRLTAQFSPALLLEWAADPLTPQQVAQIEALQQAKYEFPGWTERR